MTKHTAGISNDNCSKKQNMASLWNGVLSTQQAIVLFAARTFSVNGFFQNQMVFISKKREIPEGEDLINTLKNVNIFGSSYDWNEYNLIF